MDMEEMKKSLESLPPPTSFSSLPYDVVLNILSRISRFHSPILSLVSKSFRSLIASCELEDSRTLIGQTEDYLYVCLDPNKNNHNPRLFLLAPIPKRERLIPIPFPYEHLESSTIFAIGSDIYIIGGNSRGRSRRVLVLHCRSHQWRRLPDSRSHQWIRLPNMIIPRARPAAEVIDGKVYVIGGGWNTNIEDWGEVYDPMTQTWETFSLETLDLTAQKSVVPGRLVMDRKVYDMKLTCHKHICLVEIDKNVFCQICVCGSGLCWRDANEDLFWTGVMGLEGLNPNPYFPKCLISVVNSSRGRRVTVWWKEIEFSREDCHDNKECKTEIWCAEISLQRCGFKELRGVVEWSNSVFTLDGCDTGYDFSLDSAVVTH